MGVEILDIKTPLCVEVPFADGFTTLVPLASVRVGPQGILCHFSKEDAKRWKLTTSDISELFELGSWYSLDFGAYVHERAVPRIEGCFCWFKDIGDQFQIGFEFEEGDILVDGLLEGIRLGRMRSGKFKELVSQVAHENSRSAEVAQATAQSTQYFAGLGIWN